MTAVRNARDRFFETLFRLVCPAQVALQRDVLFSLWPIAKALLLLAGLLVPGAMLMRALRVPSTVGTSFAGSILALYTTVLALQFLSLRISLASLTAGLVLITFAAAWAHHRDNARRTTEKKSLGSENVSPLRLFVRMGPWAPVYLALWCVILWRAWHAPLSGADVEFRWSFLAEQMLQRGSLDFYPPRSAEDFFAYFWVESIPPAVAAMHAWAYACAGGINANWTVPAVILQLWALHEILWLTADRIAGERAARFTVLATAACPLLTWSALLGQETGLTALSLVGLVYALRGWDETRSPRWAALAGSFAALGATAREYGLVFPILAALWLLLQRADRRTWLAFATLALIGFIWPLRTFILTGNPFYSLPFAACPTNPRFLAWIEFDANALGAELRTFAGWREIARYFLSYVPAAVFGWAALLIAIRKNRRGAPALLVGVILMLALWIASVRYTNGGLFYSMRVTSPAVALGALAAGIALASSRLAIPRFASWTTLAMGLLLCLTFPATLALPKNPLRTSWREWPVFATPVPLVVGKADDTVALVLHSGNPGVVIADGAGFQRRFAPTGIRVIPLWSSGVDWLFDPALPPDEALRQWRRSGVTHLILTKFEVNFKFFNAHARTSQPHSPFRLRPVGETPLTAVFVIEAAD